MEGNVKKVLSGVGFYGTLAVCLTIVGVCGWLLLSDRQEPAVETPVTPQVPVSQPVKMPERAVETPVETLKPAPVEETPEPEPADTAPVAAEAPRLTVDPLQGEVLTAFSMEELVYSPTLGDWRTHNGIDIAANTGCSVQAVADGVIDETGKDAMGEYVIISHAAGFITKYMGLENIENLTVGKEIKSGEVIGTSGKCTGENVTDPHIHFEMSKDGVLVNPTDYLPQQ